MAGKWEQVAQSEKFQGLDEWKRQEVRSAFFDREIRPKAPADKVDTLQSAFFTRTEPDVFGRRETDDEGVGAMDYVKELGAGLQEGTGSVLQGVGDLVEQGGQWVDRGLHAIGLGEAVDAGDEALGGASISEAARGAGKWFGEGGQEMRETQSKAAQQARADSTPQGDVTKPSTWSMGDDPSIAGYGLQVSNLIGQFAPQAAALLAPGGAARAVGMAGVGSMQAGGAAGEDAEQYVMQQSDKDLAQNSGMYRDLVDQGVEPGEAKRQTAVAARGAAFAGAAPVGGAGGALTHYILGPFQRAVGGGVGRRLGYGLAVDSPAEGAQEVAETVAGRTAQNQATQGSRDTTDGTFGDAALGAIAGGGHAALGAAMGERLPQRNRMPMPDEMVRERTPEDIADAEQQYQRDRDTEAQQFVDRRRAEERSAAAVREQFGENGKAVWQNADNDLPVTVRGIEPEPDESGRYYARVERNGQKSFVPLDELRTVERPPAEQAEEAPASSRQPTLGIDNDIRVAEKIGADEDAARLRNAKSLFVRAMQADEAGNGSMASRLRQRGIRIHQDIYGDPETAMPERPASFPVPYEFAGEVEPGARPPAASQAARQAATYDGSPDPRLNRPAQRLRQGDQATGESIVFGEGPTVRRGNANTGMDQPFERARMADTAPRPEAPGVESLRGEPIDTEWRAFSPRSGSLNIPRSQMPQVKAEHRGALANFLKARGINGTERTVPATSLRPTQSEFSEERVQTAKNRQGSGDRAILVSSDGRVLDGHHQWLARRDNGEDVRVIQLDAPVDRLLNEIQDFPSAEVDQGAGGQRDSSGDQPASEKRAQRIASEMSRDEIRGELDALSDEMNRRYDAAMEGADPNIVLNRRNFLSDAELARMADLQQALPSSSQERIEARERIGQRLAERRERRNRSNGVVDQADRPEAAEASATARDRSAAYSMGRSDRNPDAPSSDQVRAALNEMGERLGDFEVVDSTSELPIRLQLAIAAAGAEADGVRGFYEGDRLYIIASNNDSIQRAVMTAVHEAVGHKGVRGVLGDELTPVMRQLYNSLPHSRKGREALSEVLENYPFLDRNNPDDQVMIAEEMVAHLLEKGARPRAWQRALAAIREMLRRRFPSIAWTYTDVLALGERSRDFLRRQDPADTSDISFSLRPKRQPTADQFNDLSDDQKDFMAKFGSKTPTRRAMDWYRDIAHRAGLRIRQGMIDQYAALKELDEKRFGKDGALKESITSSSWVLARMSNAANGALHAMLHNGRIALDPDQKVIDVRDDDSKGLGAVLGRLGSPAEIERFMMWIAANRSDKLKGEGREFLFTDAEIRAGMQLNQGRTADGASRRERYQEAFEEFQQYRDDVLAIAEQSGIIRPDQRAMWRDEFYVPFYRLKDDKDVNVQLGTSGLSRQQAYKRLKGGTDNINDLLQNTMMNFHHLLDASLKNQAAQQAIQNAEDMGMARVVPESNRDTAKSTFVMQDGVKRFYEIDDPMVYQAMSALAHPGMNNTIMKVMRGFKRVFTNMTTTTPQFIVANLMRDTMQAVATNEVSANVFKNIYEGAGTLRDQRKRARMLAAGGSFNFGHLYSNNPDELRAQLTRNLRDANVIGVPGAGMRGFAAPAQLIRAGWAKWGDMNDFAENLNRAAIYEQNQEKGKLKAAFEARDLIDFSARGAWPAVRILTDIVPFLNARIQGLDKIYRSGVKPGANVLKAAMTRGDATVSDKQAAARFWSVAGAVTLATVALYLNNHDDEDYQKLEEWQKDTYWHFFVGGQHFIIPKPFEVGAIATMAERMTQQFVDDEATGSLFAQRMGHMLTGTFAFSPVPQMFQPSLDIYSNRDSFTDRPIEGMGDERLSPELRKRDNTSRVAQGASWLLNNTVGAIGSPDTNPLSLSPLQIDHLIQGYLGQVGAWAASSVDVVWNTFDGKDEPAKRWYEYQPVRRFYSNLGDEPRYTRYGTVFYEGLREAERAYSDVKELGELGRIEEARELAKSKADLLRLRKPLMGAQRKLNSVRKQIEAVRRSDLDGELKRQRIDRLTAVKNRIQQVLGEKILEQRAAE